MSILLAIPLGVGIIAVIGAVIRRGRSIITLHIDD
jgi:hypothetical protein